MRLQRAALALALAATAFAIVVDGRADLFDELYARGQKQNGSLRTFTASFTETTTSSLLTRPLVARGTVAVERPARVALRYTSPDERVVVIDGDRLTLSWPSRAVLQTRDIGASQRRVQKYFIDSSPSELRSHFQIAARRDGNGPFLIAMTPTRKQIKEGLARIDLTVDPVTLLMSAMKMTFPNGDTKEMTFDDVKPNALLETGAFAAPK
jgi:outer membrane lipoprotein-sorting protein